MMKIKFLIVGLSQVLVSAAIAAGGEHGHAAIPWSQLIIPQTVNVLLVVSLLTYLLKNPLKEHFQGRVEAFNELRRLAEATKAEAEEKNRVVRTQLSGLETTAQQNVEEARQDAQKLKKQLAEDAQNLATKMEQEASRIAQFELDRAIATLRTELVTNSVRFAESNIKESVNSATQEGLNKEFLSKVQGVKL